MEETPDLQSDDENVLQVEVRECFGSVTQTYIRPAIIRLLSGIPQNYLAGLKIVVLNDATAVAHGRKHPKVWVGKRKVPAKACRGLYHAPEHGNSAWIELFVDNITRDWPPLLLRVPFIGDVLYSEVLFHEIGHHIQRTRGLNFKDKERLANEWKKLLSRHYFKRRYWYLLPVILPAAIAMKMIKAIRKNRVRNTAG